MGATGDNATASRKRSVEQAGLSCSSGRVVFKFANEGEGKGAAALTTTMGNKQARPQPSGTSNKRARGQGNSAAARASASAAATSRGNGLQKSPPQIFTKLEKETHCKLAMGRWAGVPGCAIGGSCFCGECASQARVEVES